MLKENLKFSIDIAVNCTLSETEKNQLMVALGNAVRDVLGPTKSGYIEVCSEPSDEKTLG
ncbi:MAG: hypothetical protein HYT94_03195 [Parcubacteria group bacterium]|nr:hypothetical protein [Parcubacteria group bacterium]